MLICFIFACGHKLGTFAVLYACHKDYVKLYKNYINYVGRHFSVCILFCKQIMSTNTSNFICRFILFISKKISEIFEEKLVEWKTIDSYVSLSVLLSKMFCTKKLTI